MKKILSIVIALVLMLCAAVIPSHAAQTDLMTVDSAYYTSGTLYAYVEPAGAQDLKTLTIKPAVDSSGMNTATPKPITETDTTIDYILLIDASASIRSYLSSVFSFVSSLMNTEALKTEISVASFGESFRLIADGLTTPEQVSSVVENDISYTENYTDICGGVVDAIEYIHRTNRTKSEVINLVVITDGKAELGDTSPTALTRSADKAEAVITTSPEIILHTMCFGGDWEQNAYRALSKGTGLNEDIDTYSSETAAAVAGSRMASKIDSLYTFSLDFSWEYKDARSDVELRVQLTDNPKASLELFTVENVADLENIADADSDDGDPVLVPNTEDTTDTDDQSPAETEAPSEADGTLTPTEDGSSSESLPATADQLPSGGFTGSMPFPILWVIIGAAALLVLGGIAVLIILLIRKNKKKHHPLPTGAASSPQAPSGPAIGLTLEILQGSASAYKDLKLNQQLFIGSGNDCDIVLNDPTVSDHNARIFMENGMIYIEDISPLSNTYLEGMKLFSKNRLRSGDEITIGNTVFKLLF